MIDTAKDSTEDIEKAIKLLSTLISGKSRNSNIFEDSSPSIQQESPASGGLFAMFGDNSTQKPEPIEEKKKEKMQIMEY